MTSPPSATLPEGMSEADYEAIEAAVTETVRGRWFLAEFARRNRIAETRQLLDAMGRIETAITAQHLPGPAADPSVRLLMQRIKEIAGQLHGTADDMRAAGVAPRLVDAVDLQARAVGGLMRNPVPAAPTREALPERAMVDNAGSEPVAAPPVAPERVVSVAPPAPEQPAAVAPRTEPAVELRADDPRLAALSGLDRLSFADKLALFG